MVADLGGRIRYAFACLCVARTCALQCAIDFRFSYAFIECYQSVNICRLFTYVLLSFHIREIGNEANTKRRSA